MEDAIDNKNIVICRDDYHALDVILPDDKYKQISNRIMIKNNRNNRKNCLINLFLGKSVYFFDSLSKNPNSLLTKIIKRLIISENKYYPTYCGWKLRQNNNTIHESLIKKYIFALILFILSILVILLLINILYLGLNI